MTLAFSYSRPTTASLLKLANKYYPDFSFDSCRFYHRGLHDNYLLKNSSGKYILRLYRTQWRNEEAIRFELDVLSFLYKRRINVSAPIQNYFSEKCFSYDAPEGTRLGALFPYAEGIAPEQKLNNNQVQLLGQSVAKIHLSLDEFNSDYSRIELDEKELIDASISHIADYLDQDNLRYLKSLGERLKDRLSILNKQNANFGVVTGDINFRNFHINPENKITHFDFDQCGYAYRAFEIGKFASFIGPMENSQKLLDEFIQAYIQVNPLSDMELSTVPLFEMVSIIWVMAIGTQNESLIGYKWIEKGFWEHRFSRLEKLEKKLLE